MVLWNQAWAFLILLSSVLSLEPESQDPCEAASVAYSQSELFL